jgi:hypothetical protein
MGGTNNFKSGVTAGLNPRNLPPNTIAVGSHTSNRIALTIWLPPLGDQRRLASYRELDERKSTRGTPADPRIRGEPRVIRTRPRMVVMVISGECGLTGAPRAAQALSMRCRAIAGTDPVSGSFARSRGAVNGRAFKGNHARPPPCVESVHGTFPPYLSVGPTLSGHCLKDWASIRLETALGGRAGIALK